MYLQNTGGRHLMSWLDIHKTRLQATLEGHRSHEGSQTEILRDFLYRPVINHTNYLRFEIRDSVYE